MSDIKMSDDEQLLKLTEMVDNSIFIGDTTMDTACMCIKAVKTWNNHDRLMEENAKLKADEADLLNWIQEAVKSNELNMPLHNTLCGLIQKHKGENNG